MAGKKKTASKKKATKATAKPKTKRVRGKGKPKKTAELLPKYVYRVVNAAGTIFLGTFANVAAAQACIAAQDTILGIETAENTVAIDVQNAAAPTAWLIVLQRNGCLGQALEEW